jgi:hypothetical protein
VRRIEQDEPEPIDLLDVAGHAVVSRAAKLSIPVGVLLVLVVALLLARGGGRRR